MLLENEPSLFADVVLDAAVLLGRWAPAVVDDGRVLKLREAATGSVNARSVLRHDHLLLLLAAGRIAVLNLCDELLLVVIVPEIAPALGYNVTLLAEDGRHAAEGSGCVDGKRARDGNRTGAVDLDRVRAIDMAGLEGQTQARIDERNDGSIVLLDPGPRGIFTVRAREEVLGVDLGIRDSGQLAERLRRGHGQSLGPGEGAAIVDVRRRDGGSAKRLAVGAGDDGFAVVGAELVEAFVVNGEADDASESLLDKRQVALLGIDSKAVHQDLERVLGHVGKHVEERLTVQSKVGIEGVRGTGDGERVAGEEHIEQADAERPNVCLCGRVAGAGWVVLLRSHVAVATDSNLPRPSIGGGQAKVTELHRARLSDEDVLRLDITVVDALGVHKLDSADQLEHEIAHMLRLERALAEANGFIEVAIRAELEHKVDVVGALEGLEAVDNVRVRADAEVDAQLLGALVNSEGGGAASGRRGLCDDLDGNVFVGYQIAGLEDHAKGAMVEGTNGFVLSIEYSTWLKLVAHALHGGDCWTLGEGWPRVSERSTRWLASR